jgi:zinc protease
LPIQNTPGEDNRVLTTQDVQTTVLENGLTLLTRELHTLPTVSSMIWYRVGSRNEQSGSTGQSHFLEHMLFKGTERFGKGEIDRITMRSGGSNNAFTSFDFTAYYFCFASDRWEIALDIESDRMVNTAFEPAEFTSERNVVIEELKAGLDHPWGRLMQEMNAQAFQAHPYRNPVIGTLEDLETSTVDGMRSYYRRHYTPSNATLVVVGDFETPRVVDGVRAAFGDIRAGKAEREARVDREPPQTAERRFEIPWRSEVPRIALAFHAPPIAHPDSYALQVLAVLLTEGKASCLYQRVVEKERLATFVSAEYAESMDPTLFYVRAEGRSGVATEAIEASVEDELERLASTPPALPELARAEHQIEAHFVFSMERFLDQAMLYGQIATIDRLDYIDQYLPRIRAVTSDDVSRVVREYLGHGNRTVGRIVFDPNAAEGGAAAEEDAG